MNKPIILIILSVFIVSGNLFGQSAWENVPQATQFSPTDMEFTDLNNGWVTTVSGYIAHTADGGNTWSLQGNYDAYSASVSIDMLSATHGYVTMLHKILETTDGENWNEIVVDTMNNIFEEINFLNDTVGIVLVTGSMVWKTTDGGQTWDTIFANPNFYLGALQFVDENTMIAVGQDPGYGNLIVSHDGGLSWTEPQGTAGLWLTDVYFTSNLVGYIVGQNGVFKTTIDGGLTWQTSSVPNPSFPSVYFTSASTGFVHGDQGACFRTTDGGNTWVNMSVLANRNYSQMYFIDSLHGWRASSVLTEIQVTSDGGLTWSSLYTGSGWGLTDIEFSSNTEGWACGIRGTVMHTIDGGNTWSLIESPLQVSYLKLEISAPNTVWIIDDQGTAFHTNDDGVNWYVTQISPQGSNLLDIDFPTPQVGYIVGPSYINKTINGGSSWTSDWVPGTNYSSVDFLNVDTGMTITGQEIFRTTNGGTNWDAITPAGTYFFADMAFPAQDTAYVVGSNGLILSTYDNGNTWIQQNSGTTSVLATVSFSSSTNGRASGYDGVMLVTLDAGVTWLPEATPSQVQISAITMTPDQEGWASKVDGNLLKFNCSSVDSMNVNTYTLDPASNCNGSVTLSSASGESFVTGVSGQNEVVNGSADLFGFCEGLYTLDGYNSCGNGLNGRFVIPDPAHFFGTSSVSESILVSRMGRVQELCGQQLVSVTYARLLSVSFVNSTTVQAQWEIISPSGVMQIPALYEVNGNGWYTIQLSLYCEENSFEGIVITGDMYVENNTVVLKTSELEMENVAIFPNPASGKIAIRFESGTADLIVRDINGKQLLSREITSNDFIDLSNFSNGILLFEISTENGKIMKRVVKH
nr:YCF48-related protein [uncultured Fluviicola sp.]